MGETNETKATVAWDIIRAVFSFLDRPAYLLLGLIYQLFFNVASADIFSNDTIMKFYGRVQVILGVFMMFQLAMTILRGIVEPDNFTKEKGAGSLLRRVVVSLLMITALMPVNITSTRNEYEIQLHNNGLLFGTLYSLQHRILSNNTIGRLVLGTNSSSTTYMNSSDDTELEKSAKIFTSTILKGFYRINLVPSSKRVDSGGKDPATVNENRMCKKISSSVLNKYTRVDAEPGDIIGLVNEKCTVDGEKRYAFNYTPLLSMIVAFVFAFILLSFTIDVAVRAVKLAVLRLIAPIPLISYINPTGKGDESFKAWTKALTTTYLDLFIRLAVVYFVIFLIQDMIVHGIVINHGTGIIGVFSLILIWIALFIFAKQAPKFIKEVLGLKGDSAGKIFGGFGEIAAAGTMVAGTISGGISNAAAKYSSTSGNQGKRVFTGIGGFITGSVGGGVNATKGYFGSEKPDAKANMAKIREYNARNYSNAADESTPFGRFTAGLQRDVGLKNQLQRYDDKIKYFGLAEEAVGRMNKAFDNHSQFKVKFDDAFINELKTTGAKRGYSYQFDSTTGDLVDKDGNVILKKNHVYSLKDLSDVVSTASSSGDVNMKDAVTEAKKQAQGKRFEQIRVLDRKDVVRNVQNHVGDWTENDLIIYDSGKRVYTAYEKFPDDPVFIDNLKGKKFENASWGNIKGAAGGAGRKKDQLKSSDEYAKASANAKRAEEAKKK